MSIYLWEGKTIVLSDMQWPCDDGFHVPTKDEFQWLINTLSSIWYSWYNNIKSYLKLPPAWYYSQRWSLTNKWNTMWYWTCSPNGNYSFYFEWSSSYTGFYWQGRCYWATIRPFKDKFIIPDSTWIVILWTIWSSWVFWNQNDWIISVTSNWATWYTIADKNLWATTVYDNWTATDANCGSYFQWGNNYWFPSSWITTSSSQVNASTYWPWNYYSSSTFIAYASNPYNWDNSYNTNLRWWVSQWSSSRIEPNVKEIYLWEWKTTVLSDMQWPCPDWFHVPTKDEWDTLSNLMTWLSQSTAFVEKLHIPLAWYRSYSSGSVTEQWTTARFWTSIRNNNSNSNEVDITTSWYSTQNRWTWFAYTIRPFKNHGQ